MPDPAGTTRTEAHARDCEELRLGSHPESPWAGRNPDLFRDSAAAHCVAGAEKAGRPRPFRRSRFGGSVESGRVGTRGVVGEVLEGYETR